MSIIRVRRCDRVAAGTAALLAAYRPVPRATLAMDLDPGRQRAKLSVLLEPNRTIGKSLISWSAKRRLPAYRMHLSHCSMTAAGDVFKDARPSNG
jgi:hypothetical protein